MNLGPFTVKSFSPMTKLVLVPTLSKIAALAVPKLSELVMDVKSPPLTTIEFSSTVASS